MKTIITLSCLLFLSACKSTRHLDQISLFTNKHPLERGKYTMLASTSVEYIEHLEKQHRDMLDAFIDGVESRVNSPEELQSYLNGLRKLHNYMALEHDPEWQTFVKRLSPHDSLYLFNYQTEHYGDYGLLVIRNGEIVYRSPWASWWTPSKKPDTKFEIDKLEQPAAPLQPDRARSG